ncbi:hypothetical protein BJX64DRAFT_283161 [Aspergillus heterothallicus]
MASLSITPDDLAYLALPPPQPPKPQHPIPLSSPIGRGGPVLGSYATGFVRCPGSGGHLHKSFGRVMEILWCDKLVEVVPLVKLRSRGAGLREKVKMKADANGELRTESEDEDGFVHVQADVDIEGFRPASYEHFSRIAKRHRLGDLKNAEEDPSVDSVAAGYWVDDYMCLRYGVGRVVKVWKDFKVRFVDPSASRSENEALSRKGKQSGPKCKRVRFDYVATVHVLKNREEEEVRSIRERVTGWRRQGF